MVFFGHKHELYSQLLIISIDYNFHKYFELFSMGLYDYSFISGLIGVWHSKKPKRSFPMWLNLFFCLPECFGKTYPDLLLKYLLDRLDCIWLSGNVAYVFEYQKKDLEKFKNYVRWAMKKWLSGKKTYCFSSNSAKSVHCLMVIYAGCWFCDPGSISRVCQITDAYLGQVG